MSLQKKSLNWPVEYETPRVFNVDTAFQQALGITFCSTGTSAGGGSGSCSSGYDATGTPNDPNACATGALAMIGPGHGMSPCGHGFNAQA
ncbi:MAG: hypothetical protein H8D96_07270 [Desulfobacterales bacterium]|uniref:Uncharacterized protein n=1 Tax=Candidatus Desulfatibia vada TaxID=2841696 RepID=A0A8J6TS49_9BACT|nr:hypothetical protein [Candidatus Desulfatibia vada]MBL6972241.1 hypothetical protein [Desulfobacterales bacterium]